VCAKHPEGRIVMPETYARTFRSFAADTPRMHLRNAALSVLAPLKNRTATYLAALNTPRIHFLYGHYVFEDEEQGFRSMLEWLIASGHTFLSYSEAVERLAKGPIDRPYVCFSFDDGVGNCVRAAQILEAYAATACFFMNGINLGDDAVIKPMLYTTRTYGRLPVRYMNWREVEQVQNAGHEIGGHTYSHINMGESSPDLIREELHRNRELLSAHGVVPQHFAWPFGRWRHFSRTAQDLVFAAGYTSCASAERGVHLAQERDAASCIRRDNFVGAWPLAHLKYFMAESILGAGRQSNGVDELKS
jgi:peptidoglycan/xylan/chitin deacetylase (PgdA/CDA1 family)